MDHAAFKQGKRARLCCLSSYHTQFLLSLTGSYKSPSSFGLCKSSNESDSSSGCSWSSSACWSMIGGFEAALIGFDRAGPYNHIRDFCHSFLQLYNLRTLCNKYHDAHGFSYSSAASNASFYLLFCRNSAQSSNLLFIGIIFSGDGIVLRNSVASS